LQTLYRQRATRLLQDPDIKRLVEENMETNGGDPEFEQITEKDLLMYLRKGYQIVYQLGNGDVIVRPA